MRRTVKGANRFYAQFIVSVRAIGMSEEVLCAENLRVIHENSKKLEDALNTGRSVSRMRFRRLVSNIVEFPRTTPLVEKIREAGLSHKFEIGFDLGPKCMAAYLKSEQESITILQPILTKLQDYSKEIALLQRKLDRQRRANNPDNYNPNGTIKKKKRLRWRDSNGYKETRGRINELNRLVRQTRKTAIGEITNIFSALGKSFKAEDISYKTWQVRYGKSVARYAPSTLMNTIHAKAESAGLDGVKIPLKCALSQICLCGAKEKKPLSQRLHECTCGVSAQRDVFSSYLALFHGPSGVWEGFARLDHRADRQLLEASRSVYKAQAASGGNVSFVLRLNGRQSCSCPNGDRQRSESHQGPVGVYPSLKHLMDELCASSGTSSRPGACL